MPWALVPALAVFAVLGIVLAVVDVHTHRLPDVILLPGAAAVVLSLCVAAVWVGEPSRLLGVGGGAIGAFLVCFALHLARPASFGGGDVKLAGLCGALLGWGGVEAVASGSPVASSSGVSLRRAPCWPARAAPRSLSARSCWWARGGACCAGRGERETGRTRSHRRTRAHGRDLRRSDGR